MDGVPLLPIREAQHGLAMDRMIMAAAASEEVPVVAADLAATALRTEYIYSINNRKKTWSAPARQ